MFRVPEDIWESEVIRVPEDIGVLERFPRPEIFGVLDRKKFNLHAIQFNRTPLIISNYIRSLDFIKFTFNQLIIKICNIGDLTYGTIDEHYSNLLKCNDPIESKFKAVGRSALPDWYDEKLFKA